MYRPLISVIILTYEQERFIGACIESLLKQTYDNFEAIVVDDGSLDRTPEIVASFGDERIKFFRRPHHGITKLGDTYNFALSHCRGELVAILEGDDLWPLEKLEVQVPAFQRQDIVLCWGRGVFIDEMGRELYCTPSAWRHWPQHAILNQPPGSSLRYFLVDGDFFFVPSSSIMVRREALEKIGGFWQPEGLLWVDRPTWMRLALVGPFAYVDAILGYWRIHPNQTTRRSFLIVTKTSAECFLDSLTDEDKNRLDLVSIEREVRSLALLARGRRALLLGRRLEAASHFIRCATGYYVSPKIRAKAFIRCGLIFLPNCLVREFLSLDRVKLRRINRVMRAR
jgi:glycosyltransferase involved in cell wall biosynthesis